MAQAGTAASSVNALRKETMAFNPPDATIRFLMKRALLVFLCLCATLFFFREFPQSHFVRITGDMGDSRFILGILEYWRQFFMGREVFASPQFFYPKQGVLGLSEAAFLFAAPYSLLRVFIADIYLAFQWTVMFVHVVGFASFYLLARRWLHLQSYSAAFGALLFSLTNSYYASAFHVHLRAVNFVPLILWLFVVAAELRLTLPRRANLASAAAGALCALLFFTSFYIGWFLFLALSAGVCLYLLTVASGLYPWPKIGSFPTLMISPAVTFLICLVPFCVTYLPALHQTGDRPFELALFFSPVLEDFVNVGGDNVAWGWTTRTILRHLQARPNYWEFQRGWPIIMALVFLATGLMALLRLWRSRRMKVDRMTQVVGIVFATVCLCWFLELKYRDSSLWWLVYHLVPGAKAIRVPVRFNYVLNVGVVLICAGGLERLMQACRRSGKPYGAAGITLLCAAMVFEQVNTMTSHLVDRVAEQRWLQISPPPTDCRAFYMNPAVGRPPLWANIDAILVADQLRLPTVNGYSGWFPDGWDLMTEPPKYAAAVRRWSLLNGPLQGLCALDSATLTWQTSKLPAVAYYNLGNTIDFRRGGDSQLYALDGWGEEEPGGRWTLGERARLILPVAALVAGPLDLTIKCTGFNPGDSPDSSIRVEINGQEILRRITPHQPAAWRVRFDGHLMRSGDNMVLFHIAKPRRPSDFGSSDTRSLGIAVESMAVERAQ
jgi:hypothetical protein